MIAPEDKEGVISMVTAAFEQNPRAMAMMKKKDPTRSVRLMTEYAYQLMEKMDGIYLSGDKTTVLFYYLKSRYRRTFADYLKYGKLFFTAIRPSQAFPTLKREKYIASLRPGYKDYIYVWVLASEKGRPNIHGLADINRFLYELSEKHHLPVLIETTLEKLLRLYRYVGFREYHRWDDTEAGISVWFLERPLKEPEPRLKD